MRIEYQSKHYSDVICDLLCYPIFEGEAQRPSALKALDKASRGVLLSALASGEFKPEINRTCMIHRPSGLRAKRLLLVGAGPKADFNLASLREVAGTGVRQARSARCRKVAICMRDKLPVLEAARVITEGGIGGNYEPLEHKTQERQRRGVEILLIVSEKKTKRADVETGIHRGAVIGNASNRVRNLVNEPANILTPSEFAERALTVGADSGLEVQILEREDMELLGMNSLLAVARGSCEPPKLIVLRIQGQSKATSGSTPLLAFVGKGVTFDSGGISIKPSDHMEDMKADMAGGAAVLGAMAALAQLRPRRRVVGLIPAVENLPSGSAVKPGDVVKSYLGKTIEIINTDAEGRLILADALAYARTLGATRIIDVATLTGACIVALGTVNAGMMGTDEKTIDRLRENCTITGEKLWQLPLDKAYRKALDSEVADIKNVGPRQGGAITAGKFLQEFVEDTPWVHLDIAGVDLDHDGKPYSAKGATGFGVRTLVQLLL